MMLRKAELSAKVSHCLLIQFLSVLLGSLFIGLMAQIRIPLPHTPVPITLQTFAVLLLASCLGSKKGVLAVLAYLGQVLCGLPVLTNVVSHPLALVGPHAGYLFGFIPLAYCAGLIFERRENLQQITVCLSLMCVCFLQLLLGSLWLGFFVGMQHALTVGFMPFVLGEMLKMITVSVFLKSFRVPVE